MKQSTAYNHKKRYFALLKEAYDKGLLHKKMEVDIHKEIGQKIYADEAWEKVPQWVRSCIYCSADMLNALYRKYHIEWVIPFEGAIYKSFAELPPEGKEHFAKNGTNLDGVHRFMGRYVYKDDNTKPFTF